MNKREENDFVRQTLRQAMPDDLPATVAQRMQNRLAAFRRRFDTESPTPGFPQFQITHWIGGLTMRKRIGIALGGAGVVAVLGFLLLWGGIAANPVSAMERMAENIRKAKSFSAKVVFESQVTPQPDKPPVKLKMTGDIYWLAHKASRVDMTGLAPNVNGKDFKQGVVTKIDLLHESGESLEFIIDHNAKTLQKVTIPKSVPGVEMVVKLGDFSGQADRDLGIKEINGRKSRGFEINMKELMRIPPGVSEKSMAEIWIDSESSLPVFVQFNIEEGRMKNTMRFQDFRWNIDLDPKLFDTTLPKGYTDVTSAELR